MIISPSHTLEYKPNDIIITSSIGYVLLHNPNTIETYVILTSLPGSTSKDLGGGASVLYPGLLTAPAPRNGCLDFHHVTVSYAAMAPCARALECSSSRVPGNPRRLRPATSRYRTRSYPMASSFVATPKNQRKPDSASLRSFAISHVV